MLKTSRGACLWVLLVFCCADLPAIDFIRGDSNGDGEVNISDAQHCLQSVSYTHLTLPTILLV